MIQYKKALFLHVPKTGGSWIRSVLREAGGKDVSYPHDIPANKKFYMMTRNVKPFCIIRHPLEYVHSIWKHWSGNPRCRTNNMSPMKDHMWDKHHTSRIYLENIVEGDFEKTIANFNENWPGFVSWLYGQYMRDSFFVGRHERLRDDLARALILINGRIDDDLQDLIRSKNPVNVSLGAEAVLSQDLARKFIDQEPIAKSWGYEFFPEFVIQK